MATKKGNDTVSHFNQIITQIKNREFKPLYLLMGEEPYYSDIILDTMIEHALTEQEREFNQTIIYGNDTNAADIVMMAKRYPVFAERQLVIIKEAQTLSGLDPLEQYLQSPAPETILVLAYTNKSADKRTGFYKKAKSVAEVFESTTINEWEIPNWIKNHVKQKGVKIEDDAAQLMAEHTGNNLRKIVLECDKLLNAIPIGESTIRVKDIEVNIGISREYNAFELCRAISFKDLNKAYKIALYFGANSKKYPLVLTFGAMFFYFSRLLKCHAYSTQTSVSQDNAIKKAGVFGGQATEYKRAMGNYSINQTMKVISLIREYDHKSKSHAGGSATEGELLAELIYKIFH